MATLAKWRAEARTKGQFLPDAGGEFDFVRKVTPAERSKNSVLTIGRSDFGGRRAEARYCRTALMMPEAEVGSVAMRFGQHHDLL